MRPQNAMIDMLHTRICVLNTWYFTGHTGLVGKWMYYGWWSAHPKISSTWDPYYSLFTPKSCWIRVQFSDPSMGFCCSIGSTSITLTSQRSSNHYPLRWSDDPRLPGFFLCKMVSSCQQKQSSIPVLLPHAATSTEGLPPETRRWSSVPWGRRVCRRPHQSWERKIWSSGSSTKIT